MTADRPTGGALLAIAARVLRRDVLPGIAPDKKLETLMVLRSMEIAGRELADGGATEAAWKTAVAGLYGEPAVSDRRLAEDIRAGRHDDPDRAAALHAILLADTARRLALANPKYRKDGD